MIEFIQTQGLEPAAVLKDSNSGPPSGPSSFDLLTPTQPVLAVQPKIPNQEGNIC